MPTGYTAAIQEGASFEQFVWSCARAFGALIEMRDEPANAPIPTFEPSSYNMDRLKEEEKRLLRLKKMTAEEKELAAQAECNEALKHAREREKKNADTEEKYKAILDRVKAWNPPTKDHEGMKKFMIKQIEDSIRFDCYEVEAPIRKTGEEWFEAQLKEVRGNIEYHKKAHQEEIERVKSRNEWVQALNKSVPMPAKLRG